MKAAGSEQEALVARMALLAKGHSVLLGASSYGGAHLPEAFEASEADSVALFESAVEAAYLVAHADGHFDELERSAFRSLVISSYGHELSLGKVDALLGDLAEALAQDGLERRVQVVGRSVRGLPGARSVLWVAALVAAISRGVSPEERAVLRALAGAAGLGAELAERSLEEALHALFP